MIFSKIISASGAACWVLCSKRNLQSWYEKWRKAVSKTRITQLKFRVYPNPPVLLTAVQDYDCWVIFCLFMDLLRNSLKPWLITKFISFGFSWSINVGGLWNPFMILHKKLYFYNNFNLRWQLQSLNIRLRINKLRF